MTPKHSLETSSSIHAETRRHIQEERITYRDQRFTFMLAMLANFLTISIIISVHNLSCGRNSADGIATRCGMDGPGIQIRWCNIFCAVQTDTNNRPQWVPGLSWGNTDTACWWPPQPYGAEVTNELESNLRLPSVPAMAWRGVTMCTISPLHSLKKVYILHSHPS
jgi:hypothetical protein